MKYLTGVAWDAFKKQGTSPPKFDGDAFETLIRVLLRASFPGDWEGTPKTRDGGKDVVDRSIPGSVTWAECKMYRAPISLQIVSNTLVMAIVEPDVQRILFFSHSEMIGNAKNYLAKFAAQTGKTIQVFDGEILEELILRSPAVMGTYFKNYSMCDALNLKKNLPHIKAYFSSDVHVSQQQIAHSDGMEKPRQHTIPIYTPCLYEIIFIARHAQGKLKLGIKLHRQEFENFEILNTNLFDKLADITLDAGQTLSVPIYLAPLLSGPLTIPALCMQDEQGLTFELPSVELTASSLVRPVLIGKKVQEYLRALEATVSSGNANRIFAVHGKSGVGKSRFVDEAMTSLLKNGYEIHYFDGLNRNTQSIEGFIKTLLCSLWRLPDAQSFLSSQSSSSPDESVAAIAYGQVSEIIYNWDTQKIKEESTLIEAALADGLRSHRAAVVVDNVQAFPAGVIAVLKKLCASVVASPGQAAFMLAFNDDDLVFNDAAADWLEVLNHSAGKDIQVLNLLEFTIQLAEEFLDNLFSRAADGHVFSETYPNLVATILDKVIPRPLDIFQFVKGLEDRGAIRAGNDVFTILDFEQFNLSLQLLDGARERLLDWRMERLNSIVSANLIVAAITYFGPMQAVSFVGLGIEEIALEKLVQASILRWEVSGRLAFYHPSLARHFINDTRRGKTLKLSTKQKLFSLASDETLPFTNSVEWFGLAYDVGNEVTATLPIVAASFLDQDFSGYAQNYLVADRFLQYVASRRKVDEWWGLLPSLTGAAHIASQGNVAILQSRTDYLRMLASKIAFNCPPDDSSLVHWTHLIREAAGYLAGSDSASADQLLISALNALRDKNTTQRDLTISRAEAQFLNRRCVTLKNLGYRAEATVSGIESLELATQEDMQGLVCLNLIDLGYVEYGLRERNEGLLNYWRQANTRILNLQGGQSLEVRNIRVIGELISGTVCALTGEYDSALQSLDNLITGSRERRDSFYLLQGMATKGVVLMRRALLDSPNVASHCAKVLEISRVLEDLAGSMQQDKRYRFALYLQGKAYEALGLMDKAQREYNRASAVRITRHIDYEADALRYDVKRLAGIVGMPPAATTYSINDVLLPLP
ncbi:restriction endonuclease [Undibacterium sp. CY18W]|uniref:Restriction endonuclease n=1 Tax=Undibacterium hunanense TaxID=2762292 RepID=A0ABR6ZKT0_9BURK|nr:restriction endonuclease [Undibacterium hunanense]MBC3916118.1 restriction endonuclease [Undibacterium hunanense]